MSEAEFSLPIFNRALIIRDSEGLYDGAWLRQCGIGKVPKKDNMRIYEHDPKDTGRPGPCSILVVNESCAHLTGLFCWSQRTTTMQESGNL